MQRRDQLRPRRAPVRAVSNLEQPEEIFYMNVRFIQRLRQKENLSTIPDQVCVNETETCIDF